MKTKIVKWYDLKSTVYESEKETVKEAVVEAVEKDANLRGADFYHTKFYGCGGKTTIKKT